MLIVTDYLFLSVSACDLAKEIESISHKNTSTEMKAASSQLTLLRADQLSQPTLPNSTHNLNPSSQSADNLRLHTVSVLTTSTNITAENGDESYLQIAEPKRSFDEDTDTIVSVVKSLFRIAASKIAGHCYTLSLNVAEAICDKFSK